MKRTSELFYLSVEGQNERWYNGVRYYRENPDLTVNECVETILKECGIRL